MLPAPRRWTFHRCLMSTLHILGVLAASAIVLKLALPSIRPANGILQPYENFQHLQRPSGLVLPDPGKVAA